jgi:hypothetical protein
MATSSKRSYHASPQLPEGKAPPSANWVARWFGDHALIVEIQKNVRVSMAQTTRTRLTVRIPDAPRSNSAVLQTVSLLGYPTLP